MAEPPTKTKAAVICARVGSPWGYKQPGSVVRKCSRCGHDVFVSPGTFANIAKHRLDPLFLCIDACATERDARLPRPKDTQAMQIERQYFTKEQN